MNAPENPRPASVSPARRTATYVLLGIAGVAAVAGASLSIAASRR